MSRRQMLESAPRLNPAARWDLLASGEMMVAYRKAGGAAITLVRRLFAIPEWAQLLLDETGAQVVRRIDGKETVSELIAYVALEFKLSRKEAEVALLKYMDMLGRRQLVGFAVTPDGKPGKND